uniref:Bile acid-CoA:amino acid N-acyltransferase n=1 Tax=Chelydra serpentina TaxID=8475 RepID=A0A8C3SAE2_CHESE
PTQQLSGEPGGSSLVDEPLKIQISGLPPSQLVSLQASLTDEKGVLFCSRALYWSDEAGEVDLEWAAATGGDYRGVQPMGLFQCLKPEKLFYRLLKRDVMQSPFRVRLDLFDSYYVFSSPSDQPAASQTVERWYVAPGVQQVQIRGSRVHGALFLPPGERIPISSRGLCPWPRHSSLPVVVLLHWPSYFAYEDLPSCLDEVDLECFEEAANIVLGHPKVLSIALAMATFLSQITATVCINGTSAIHGSALRYRDLHISPIPYKLECVRLTPLGPLSFFSVIGDTRAEANQGSIIPVEKTQGQILFIVGESDQNYNSKAYAEEVMERMRRHGRKNCTLLSYPGAGHLIEPPGSPFCPCSWSPFFVLPLMWGGEAQPHAAAQEHSWREIQNFLWHHLCPTGKKLHSGIKGLKIQVQP